MKHFLILIFCLFAVETQAQNWTDAKVFCKFSKFAYAKTAIDSKGNFYVGGKTDSVNLAFYYDTTRIHYGKEDIFLAKFNQKLELLWVHTFGSKYEDKLFDLKVDELDNVFLTGAFSDTFHIINEVLISNGLEDVFLIKLNQSGEHIWSKGLGGKLDDSGESIICNDGRFFFSGMVQVTDTGKVYFDSILLPNFASGFISEIDEDGKFLWVKRIGNKARASINLFVSDNDLYVLGSSAGNKILYDTNVYITTNGNWNPVFVAKMSKKGDLKWLTATYITGLGNNLGANLVIDSLDNVYLTGGATLNSVEFLKLQDLELTEIYGWNNYIAKFNYDGKAHWIKIFGGSGIDENGPFYLSKRNTLLIGCRIANFSLWGTHDTLFTKYYGLNSTIIEADLDGNIKNYEFFGGSGANYLDDMLYLPETDELIVIGQNLGTKMNFGNLQFDNCDDAQIYIAKRDFKPKNVSVSKLKKLPVQIFPNPATNSLELVNLGKNAKGSIYSLNGTNMANYIFKDNSTWVDINFLERGMYIFKIDSDNQSYILKFYRL
jgi:hypothetical protein